MTTDAVPAAIVPPPLAWRSLLWTVPITLLWTWRDRARGRRRYFAWAIAICGGDPRTALRATLVANAYLEAEVERLSEAIFTGFARGRIRKPPTKSRR
jgi:hypothetical protein